jgi:hypothetical protein
MITDIVESVTHGMRTRAYADRVAAFFETHSLPMAARTIAGSISRIRNLAARIDRSHDALAHFFESM